MLRRWLSSAGVYTLGESSGACLDDRTLSLDRIATVAMFGATADAVALRAFHVAVETRLPSPLFRMLAEQVRYAPFSNTAYLTMAKKTDWTCDEFTGCTLATVRLERGELRWISVRPSARYL